MTISRFQAAAARAGLGLNRKELAKEADVAERTIMDFERGARDPIPATKSALRITLEKKGAVFTPEGGVGFSAAAITVHRITEDGEAGS